MRELKFRGYCKQRKEMLEIQRISFKNNKVLPYGWNMPWDAEEFEIMQFTGLYDKNNKPIYEGDIVAQFNFKDTSFRTEVVYINGSFGYVNPIFREFIAYSSNSAFEWDTEKSKRIEVLGNIYENPELLEG